MDRVDAGDLARVVTMNRKYNYRRKLPHLQKDNRPVFVSFNTVRQWEIPHRVKDAVLECCLYQHGKMAAIHAVVARACPHGPHSDDG